MPELEPIRHFYLKASNETIAHIKAKLAEHDVAEGTTLGYELAPGIRELTLSVSDDGDILLSIAATTEFGTSDHRSALTKLRDLGAHLKDLFGLARRPPQFTPLERLAPNLLLPTKVIGNRRYYGLESLLSRYNSTPEVGVVIAIQESPRFTEHVLKLAREWLAGPRATTYHPGGGGLVGSVALFDLGESDDWANRVGAIGYQMRQVHSTPSLDDMVLALRDIPQEDRIEFGDGYQISSSRLNLVAAKPQDYTRFVLDPATGGVAEQAVPGRAWVCISGNPAGITSGDVLWHLWDAKRNNEFINSFQRFWPEAFRAVGARRITRAMRKLYESEKANALSRVQATTNTLERMRADLMRSARALDEARALAATYLEPDYAEKRVPDNWGDAMLRGGAIKDIVIGAGGTTITVTTNTLYALDDRSGAWHELGAYDITIDPTNLRIEFINRTRRVTTPSWRDQHHPHVFSDGHACVGNFSNIISQVAQTKDWPSLVEMCITFLQSVNTKDVAGKNINFWPFVEEPEKIGRPAYLGPVRPWSRDDEEEEEDEDRREDFVDNGRLFVWDDDEEAYVHRNEYGTWYEDGTSTQTGEYYNDDGLDWVGRDQDGFTQEELRAREEEAAVVDQLAEELREVEGVTNG